VGIYTDNGHASEIGGGRVLYQQTPGNYHAEDRIVEKMKDANLWKLAP